MINRRGLLGISMLPMVVLGSLRGSSDALSDEPGNSDLTKLPVGAKVPVFELVYESEVTIGIAEDFGDTPEGHRRIIPITGGYFRGPKLRGSILPFGADWNLSRRDGGSSVEADYYLRTDDGVTIRIHNQGVDGGSRPAADPLAEETFFMYTIPRFEAPSASRYDWMNRAVFIGTLQARKAAKGAVLIRVFQLV
jgi:hypothetical protein